MKIGALPTALSMFASGACKHFTDNTGDLYHSRAMCVTHVETR